MSHEQILEKAIQKAIDNGYNAKLDTSQKDKYGIITVGVYTHGYGIVLSKLPISARVLLFDPDFAKALWGNGTDDIIYVSGKPAFTNGYRFHLQQMAVAEDPIKYLGANI